ncbi:MAG: RNA methyltransferase [Ruminococcus sp.]|nr:RNA methyltransferase [Ruminococcus sp.]
MNGFVSVSSAANEKIKLYKRLCEDKKARKRERLFTVEGARLASDAASEGAVIKTVFVTDGAREKYSPLLKPLYELEDCSFYLITEELSRVMSRTQMPQGVFAVCEMPDMTRDRLLSSVKKGGRYLILDNIQDPGNMGTMLRTADACGIDGVMVCSCCDIFNPKTVRSAMGSIMRVRIAQTSIEEAVSELKKRGVEIYAAVIENSAQPLNECDFSSGGAVMIGNEGSGLPEEHAELADKRITIKMHGRVNSLNASAAAAIIMWELGRR